MPSAVQMSNACGHYLPEIRLDQICPKEIISDHIWIRLDPIKKNILFFSCKMLIFLHVRSVQIKSNRFRSDQVQ